MSRRRRVWKLLLSSLACTAGLILYAAAMFVVIDLELWNHVVALVGAAVVVVLAVRAAARTKWASQRETGPR